MAMVMAIGLMPATAFAADGLSYSADSEVYKVECETSKSGHTKSVYFWQAKNAEKDDVYLALITQQTEANDAKATLKGAGIDCTGEFVDQTSEQVIVNGKALTNDTLKGSDVWGVYKFAGLTLQQIAASGVKFGYDTNPNTSAVTGHDIPEQGITIPGITLNFEVDKDLEMVRVNGTDI